MGVFSGWFVFLVINEHVVRKRRHRQKKIIRVFKLRLWYWWYKNIDFSCQTYCFRVLFNELLMHNSNLFCLKGAGCKIGNVTKGTLNDILDASTSKYSSDSVEELKTKKLRPDKYFGEYTKLQFNILYTIWNTMHSLIYLINYIGTVKIEEGITYYRSNLKTVVKHMKIQVAVSIYGVFSNFYVWLTSLVWSCYGWLLVLVEAWLVLVAVDVLVAAGFPLRLLLF